MKVNRKIICLVIIACVLIFVLSACSKKMFFVECFDGDVLLEKVQLFKGQQLSDLPTPQKTGYTFMGWYADAELQELLPSSDKITQNISLFAKFQRNTYSVTFKIDNYDDIVYQVSFSDGVVPPILPNKEGYTAQWNNTDFDYIIADTVYYSIYTPIELTLTFKINGQDDIIKYVNYGASFYDIPAIPTIEGKTARWDREDFVEITSNIIINAIYEDIYLNIQFLSLSPEDETISHIEKRQVKYGDSLPYSQRPPQPYAYNGYTGVWEIVDYNYIVDDITVYAVYIPKMLNIKFFKEATSEFIVVTIPYNSNIYEYIENSETISESDKETILSPQLSISEEELRNIRYGNSYTDIHDKAKNDMEMYVIYDVIITFEYGYENGYKQLIVKQDSFIETPLVEREGFQFLGWFVDVDCTSKYNEHNSIIQDTTLYACWEEIYCQVFFPAISGVEFVTLIDLPLAYNEELSFSINGDNIYTVWANGKELTANVDDIYVIANITENIDIAIASVDIEVVNLRFYDNADKQKLLYTRTVNKDQKLNFPPQLPNEYLGQTYWSSDNGIVNFLDYPIKEDSDFWLTTIHSYYNIRYIFDDNNYIEQTIQYQDEEFKFHNPQAINGERKEGMLFEGWYLDKSFSQKATKEYVINAGSYLFLYSKWVHTQNITNDDILGLWYTDLYLLELLKNGTAIIYDGLYYMEGSFLVEGNTINIMGENAILENNTLNLLGKTLSKTNVNKCFVYSTVTGLFLIDDYMIKGIEAVDSYYWYLDHKFITPIDITQPLDPNLFHNRKLELFASENKCVTIYYDAMGGITDGNILSQQIEISNFASFQPLIPTYSGYIFMGWQIINTDTILTWDILYSLHQPDIYVQAVYFEEGYFIPTQNQLSGNYISSDDNNLYILEFVQAEIPYYHIITISLETYSFAFSKPYPYYWDAKLGFTDIDDNDIDLDSEQNIARLIYQNKCLDWTRNSLTEMENNYYKLQLEVDNPQSFVLVYFPINEEKICIDNICSKAYLYNENIYYFYIEENIIYINNVEKEQLLEASNKLPEEHWGIYNTHIEIEEGTLLYFQLKLSEKECTITGWIDNESSEEIQTKIIQLSEIEYILFTEEQDIDNMILYINQNQNNDFIYYFDIDKNKLELYKEE